MNTQVAPVTSASELNAFRDRLRAFQEAQRASLPPTMRLMPLAGGNVKAHHSVTARLRDIGDRTHDIGNRLGLAHLNRDRPHWAAVVDESETWIEIMEIATTALQMLAHSNPKDPNAPAVLTLTSRERDASFISAIAAGMRGGLALSYPVDGLSLWQLVLRCCAPEHVSYWEREGEGLTRGLANNAAIQGELERAHGILIRYVTPDKLTRISTTHRGESNAATWRRVYGEPPYGKACRNCGLEEPAGSAELIEVDPALRGGRTIQNGAVILRGRGVHLQCEPYWHASVARAAQFPTLADAEAADAPPVAA